MSGVDREAINAAEGSAVAFARSKWRYLRIADDSPAIKSALELSAITQCWIVRFLQMIGAIMKATAAIVLLSCCALAQDKKAISQAEVGCGAQDVKYEVKTDESRHPTPTPEHGKALIYVIADGHLTSIFGFDGKWVGAVNGGRYFFVSIDPGEHHLCAMLQSVHPDRDHRVSVHSLKAQPGETYYFRTRMVGINTGFFLQLDQLDSDEGRWFVAWSSFNTSHPKD